MSVSTEKPETQPAKLHRSLTVWEAIGISLALMAPSMAASINPQGTATTVGRAVPIAFALAFVGVLLVAYTFVRLTQRFHHSGSVYGFVGATLGPRAGMISGWALAGTYIFYAVTTAMAGGRFLSGFLDSVGIWKTSAAWPGFLLGLVGLALVWWIATTPAKGSTRVLVVAEGLTVLLILIVIVTVFAKLSSHSGPGHLGVTSSVFSLPSGTPISTLFLGVVFGFLSFAGFEAASTLGEETRRPNRDIPRAILGVAIFGGIYFVVVTAVESMGFGTSAAGVKAFINSPSLIGDLGTSYVSSWIGNIITIGVTISAFSCALACVVAAARLIFALGRDGVLPGSLGHVSPTRRTPTTSTMTVVIAAAVIIGFTWGVLHGSTPFNLFLEAGTIGTLILLVVYVLATIGMVKLVFFTGQTAVKKWEIIIPVLGIIVLGYTIFRNIYPWPTSSLAWWGPGAALAWFFVGLVYMLVRPKTAVRAGQMLTEAEGLASPASAGASQLSAEPAS
jgi:amino acid transporter